MIRIVCEWNEESIRNKIVYWSNGFEILIY